MSENKKERLTVDLLPDEKKELRIITAMHGEKHMQKMVIRLIHECYQRMNVGSINASGLHPNFLPEEIQNLRT